MVQQWLWTPKVNKEDKKCKKKAFIPSIIQVIEQGEVTVIQIENYATEIIGDLK